MDHTNIKEYREIYQKTLDHLKKKSKLLFLTTSNRWSGEKGGEQPKSTALAYQLAQDIGPDKVTILEVPKLKIYPCEGNVSTKRGNSCGLKDATLSDPKKNPSGQHRCWASFNNPDDELWQISKELLNANAVIFFASVRWGQLNSFYQKLIERLTWLENRHSTLGEDNLLKNIEAGLIVVGQNWNGREALATQKQVLSAYGFKIIDDLFWNWQFTSDSEDETQKSYAESSEAFYKTFINIGTKGSG
ncbi:NAD(P)H-dependent oxidoreductase [Patescibacteria group bacterium]|nr:NAD(P)H-dependent oxidoreductase [Patescibacteria group bacterium]